MLQDTGAGEYGLLGVQQLLGGEIQSLSLTIAPPRFNVGGNRGSSETVPGMVRVIVVGRAVAIEEFPAPVNQDFASKSLRPTW